MPKEAKELMELLWGKMANCIYVCSNCIFNKL